MSRFFPMTSVSYAPFGSYGATPVPQANNPPVRFELLRAGVTEFITQDGLLIQIRVNVKGIRRIEAPEGGVPYAIDADIVPTVQPALTVEPYDGPNFAQAYGPVGKKAS